MSSNVERDPSKKRAKEAHDTSTSSTAAMAPKTVIKEANPKPTWITFSNCQKHSIPWDSKKINYDWSRKSNDGAVVPLEGLRKEFETELLESRAQPFWNHTKWRLLFCKPA